MENFEKIDFKSIPALIDSNIITAELSTNTLSQFYKIEKDSKNIIKESFAELQANGELIDTRSVKSLSRRRQNLMGKTVTASHVLLNEDSKNHLTNFKQKNVDTITKMNYIIVKDLLDAINPTKKEVFRKTWGYENATTKIWNGIVGDLTQKRAEIGGKF